MVFDEVTMEKAKNTLESRQSRQAAFPPLSSSEDLPDSQVSTSNTFFGITIKKEFGLLQFWLIPLVAMTLTVVGVYMNAQLAYMLEDK